MKTIFILTVTTEDDQYIMPFSTLDKAQRFIENNFTKDSPRKLDNTLYEGKTNSYIIEDMVMDQESF